MMIGASLAAASIKPERDLATVVAPDLEALIPAGFGRWAALDVAAAVLPPEAELGPGEAVAYRAWRDPAGRVVTLVIAYGPPLGDSVRLHQPETCYRAQGYTVQSKTNDVLEAGEEEIAVVHLDTEKALRPEAVTYWLRDGDAYVRNEQGHELLFFRRGLAAPTDAALIRVSSKGEGKSAHELHEAFLSDFVGALSPEARALFLAEPS
jgi:EpsI family protein